jgi:chromate transporter
VHEVRAGPLKVDVPDVATVHIAAVALTVVAVVALFHFKLGMLATLAGCGALGIAVGLIA